MVDTAGTASPEFTIEPMPPGFVLGGFRCEPPGAAHDEIGAYLADGDAARDQAVGFSRTYLVFDATRTVIAYYTLLADAIKLAPGEGQGAWVYESAPAIKIARIGVSHDRRGRGLGRLLFRVIEGQILQIAEQIGVRYITLDAVADQIPFYQKLGFEFTQIGRQPSTEADHEAGDRSMLYDLGAANERPSETEISGD